MIVTNYNLPKDSFNVAFVILLLTLKTGDLTEAICENKKVMDSVQASPVTPVAMITQNQSTCSHSNNINMFLCVSAFLYVCLF